MNKLEYVARSLSKGTSKSFETYVINAIYQKLNNPNLEIETQKYVKTTSKNYIDLYFPQLNLSVEVDEPYHNTEKQISSDKKRESLIRNRINPEVLHVVIKDLNTTLDEINKQIDDVVSKIEKRIKDKEKQNHCKLSWYFGDELVSHLKNRGYITPEDSFYKKNDIINLIYNTNYKLWLPGTYPMVYNLKPGYIKIWFPVVSEKNKDDKLSSTNSWINYFNEDRTIMYEKSESVEKQQDKKTRALKECANHEQRIIFAKEKDQFGKQRRWFVGVFEASGWDEEKQEEIWKKVPSKSDKLEIPIKVNK